MRLARLVPWASLVAGFGACLADPAASPPTPAAGPASAQSSLESRPTLLAEVPKPAHDSAIQISEYIRCIYQDRDGHMWFGTNTEGVCRHDGKSLVFFGTKEGFAGNAAREIVQTADGAMWFTTERGVSRYHNHKFTTYTTADGLSSNDTWSMMLDRDGTLWVGTREGVCRLPDAARAGERDAEAPGPASTNPFQPFAIPRAAVETSETRFDPRLVWAMFQDRDANIWFGTDGEGVRKYDGRTFTTYTTADGLGGNQVRCIHADRDANIWIGGDNAGVTRFDGTTFRTFRATDGLANDRVFVVFEDRHGALWFSTLGAGVTRYDGTSFTPYPQLGNLPRTHVQSIFEDNAGVLWFGCSGGLFRFDGHDFINVTKHGGWR